MSVRITVRSTGFDALASAMQEAKVQLERDIFFKDLRQVAEEASKVAISMCPVDTGYLRSTIGFEVSTLAASIYATAPYAGYVNNGHFTRGGRTFVPPQPFMNGAVEHVKQALPPLIITDIQALFATIRAQVSSATKVQG